MLKTLASTEFKIRPGEGRVGVSYSSRTGQDGSVSRIDDVEVDSDEFGDNEFGKKV